VDVERIPLGRTTTLWNRISFNFRYDVQLKAGNGDSLHPHTCKANGYDPLQGYAADGFRTGAVILIPEVGNLFSGRDPDVRKCLGEIDKVVQASHSPRPGQAAV
jgi:hypothetical protein